MSAKVTEMASWRAAHARPAVDALRWSEAFETIAATHVRIFFAWQRVIMRAVWRM